MCVFESLNFLFNEEVRFIHTCEITSLTPDTIYHFKVGYVHISLGVAVIIASKEKKFKTLRQTNNVFASSGGKQIGQISTNLVTNAMRYSPEFFILGGDFVNEFGFASCFRRWDEFWREYEILFLAPGNISVPLMTLVGNNEAKNSDFGGTRENIIPYLFMFQHKIGVIGLNSTTHHSHLIGSHSSMLALDSGVAATWESQIPDIHNTWSSLTYQKTRKLVMYHTPLYPSSRDFKDKMSVSGRTYWEPLFGYYNISLSYEFHDHLLKRTKRMWNGIESANGTVYIGDGGMGLNGEENIFVERPYLVKPPSVNPHVWITKLNSTTIHLQAISQFNTILDDTAIIHRD